MCTEWRDKTESVREGWYKCSAGRCLNLVMSERINITKTKTGIKQEPYNLSDLKHDLPCGYVELGDMLP